LSIFVFARIFSHGFPQSLSEAEEGRASREKNKGATDDDYLGTTWAPTQDLSDYLGIMFNRTASRRSKQIPYHFKPIATF